MKNVIFVIILSSWFSFAYAANTDALNFAKIYEQELKQKSSGVRRDKVIEKSLNNAVYSGQDVVITGTVKMASANYKEKQDQVESNFHAFYPEGVLSISKKTRNDWEFAGDFSYGQTDTRTETWNVDGIQVQHNDLDFSRANGRVSLGKILHWDRIKPLKVTPFVNYGFRYIDFVRNHFDFLGIRTDTEVTEKYYIHYAGGGLKLDTKLTNRLHLLGTGSCAYVFYNRAHNSLLGNIDGDGGIIADGSLNMEYSINNLWKIVGGGFAEFQSLNGGTSSIAFWPDNTLNIFGGNLALRANF